MHQRTTFEQLELELTAAAQAERYHQDRCGARADDRVCAACLDYERDWLAADRALSAYLEAAARQGAA